MTRTVILIVAVSLLALTAQADQARPPKLQASLEEFRARLALTPEQGAQVRSIFEAHIEAQLETLDKYDIDAGARGAATSIDLQKMRALSEEVRANSAKIESRLAGVLSGTQMAEFRRIRAEQNEMLRDRLLSRRVDEIVAKLNLKAEQGERVRPILKEHFQTQMAILDKHGIAPGQRKSAGRPGFRTLRALRKDMRRSDARTGERLSAVLSEEQLEAYEAFRAEQGKKLRAILLGR